MKLGFKELDAIRWIMEEHNAELGACEVEEWRDAADVGWLIVTIRRTMRGTTRRLTQEFKVSPLGHVYRKKHAGLPDWDPAAIRYGDGTVVDRMEAAS